MEGFEIKASNSKKGKGLYATKKFEPGDIILEEEPLISCQFAWNAAYRYLACDYCMRPLETPEQNVNRLAGTINILLPHSDCYDSNLFNVAICDQCNIIFCSEECKEKAMMTYHQTLCHDTTNEHHPITILVETWKQMHYPPETTNIMLLLRILAYIQQSPNPQAAVQRIKNFCHRTVNEDAELVHKLLGEQFSSQLNKLRELTLNIVNSEVVLEFLNPEGFCTLMALIGTNGQGIGTSPLAMWVNAVLEYPMSQHDKQELDVFIDNIYEKIEEESGTFLNTEGSGLYTLQSACNHNCAPNAESTFPYCNHKLQLKALKLIMPGDEVCISYLDECSLKKARHRRQRELAQNYLFVCCCQRCVTEPLHPDNTIEDEGTESDGETDSDE